MLLKISNEILLNSLAYGTSKYVINTSMVIDICTYNYGHLVCVHVETESNVLLCMNGKMPW